MAPTFRHGKAAVLTLSDTAGTTFTLSSGLDDCSLDTTVETADVTTFGDDDRVYLSGLRTHSWSASGHMSSTHEGKLRGMLGNTTASNLGYGPHGNTTGFTKYEAETHITGYSVQSPVGDKVSFSISGQVTGPITSTNY
jgi:hypothetical protein